MLENWLLKETVDSMEDYCESTQGPLLLMIRKVVDEDYISHRFL